MTHSVIDVIQKHRADPTSQFFLAFGVMTTLNIVFIALLVIASVVLYRVTPGAASFYSNLVVTYFVYEIVNRSLWLMPDPWGKSIAGASAVGNMGMAPFTLFLLPMRNWMIPYAYPIFSVVVVFIAGRQLGKSSVHVAGLSCTDISVLQRTKNKVRLGTKITAGIAGTVFLLSTPAGHGLGIPFAISSFALIGCFLLLTLLAWPSEVANRENPHPVVNPAPTKPV